MQLTAGGLLIPSPLLAAGPNDRLFIYIFVRGGWDPTFVFTNQLNSPLVYTPQNTDLVSGGSFDFMGSPNRPNVNRFFEQYSDQCCIINGLEIESLTHDACRRIIFTGQASAGKDDWPAIIGSHSDYDLPVMVISGPSYTSAYSHVVVRAGEDGQLAGLLDGTALNKSDVNVSPLNESSTDHVQRFLKQRIQRQEEAVNAGREQLFMQNLLNSHEQRESAQSLDNFDLGSATGFVSVPNQIEAGIATLTEGMSRCMVVEHNGLYESGWDHHSNINSQSAHFDLLFEDLNWLMSKISMWGLEDRLSVVVFSEMGRAPQLNPISGKDHWTFTSAMLLGAGVQGGQIIGGYDSNLIGSPIDFNSGAVFDGGSRINSKHFGATLLSLAGIDPGDYLANTEPIHAALSDD